MAEITVNQLTEGTADGTGVFDSLMRATKAHLELEYSKGRIKGSDYATVYLGSVNSVLQQSMQFLLEQQQAGLNADLIAEKVTSEQLNQDLLRQQAANATAQEAGIRAETALAEQRKENLTAEALNIPKQGQMLDAQADQANAEKLLTEQQTLNAETENTVLQGQKCKLDAEYDNLLEAKLKTVAETAVLTQKRLTEKAQTIGAGVDADSVIGRQKALYLAQADGFQRDAEQKVAKLLIDSWNVRRTTDEGTVADSTNQLDDATIGRTVEKLLGGVNA